MNTHSLRTRLGVAAGGLLAAGGLAAFSIAGATGASAATPNSVQATVTVPSVTTLSITAGQTLAFTSPGTLPGPATNGPLMVTGSAVTNDSAGYQLSVSPDTADFSNGATQEPTFPASQLTYLGTHGFSFGAGNYNPLTTMAPIDSSSGPAVTTLADTWNLDVPNAPAAAYTMQIDYTIVGK